MKNLKDIKLFMLDMDGTFYLGNKLLPGAVEFLDVCRAKNIAFTFLTNNSSKNPNAYINKLSMLGVNINKEEMLTSADATLIYLEENNYSKNIMLVGTPSLEKQFINAGYNINTENPELAVLGFDTGINYEKLTNLCDAVRKGLPYIATHPDFNCPTERGYIPDIGAVIAFVNASAGRMPNAVIGKPNAFIAKAAAKRAGCNIGDLCMVGDRLYTDIALGSAGLTTALVLSGESTAEDIAKSPFKPDYIFENLAEMVKSL